MITGYQDNFTTIKSQLKKGYSHFLQDFAPDASRLYDGKIDRGTKRIKLYSRDFICSRCNEARCFYCPDCSGEKFLACSNPNCMELEATHNK